MRTFTVSRVRHSTTVCKVLCKRCSCTFKASVSHGGRSCPVTPLHLTFIRRPAIAARGSLIPICPANVVWQDDPSSGTKTSCCFHLKWDLALYIPIHFLMMYYTWFYFSSAFIKAGWKLSHPWEVFSFLFQNCHKHSKQFQAGLISK